MIKTDYSKVTDLFLTYPEGFEKENDDLKDLFQQLIKVIPDGIHQYIIVNNERAEEKIKALNPEKNITTVLIKGFNEIWLRDMLGFNTEENKIIKPIFKPDYYSNVFTKDYLREIEEQTREVIQRTTNKKIIQMPLIMDGGNLITNGEIGIFTDKVYRDNNDKSKEEVNEILQEYLNIKPVSIGTSKADKLGHSDGYVTFLNQKEICLAQYPEIKFLKDDIKYLKRVEEILLENNLEVINMYDRPVAEKVKSEFNTKTQFIYSAKGNYINFLQLNDTIILPQYTLPTKKETDYYNQKNKEILERKGKKVIPFNIDKLAQLGGGLHCISFVN